MKQLIALLAIILLSASCNNNDSDDRKRDRGNRDEYSDDRNDNPRNDDRREDDRYQDQGSTQWSTRDKDAFESKCLETLNGNREAAFTICPCLLEKMSRKYSSLDEMDRQSSESEGARLTKECMKDIATPADPTPDPQQEPQDDADYRTGGKWSSRDVKKFVDECVGAAERGGMESLDAQSYCDCMQYKIERLYPRIEDANRLTQADLSTPDMKQMIKDCLPQGNK